MAGLTRQLYAHASPAPRESGKQDGIMRFRAIYRSSAFRTNIETGLDRHISRGRVTIPIFHRKCHPPLSRRRATLSKGTAGQTLAAIRLAPARKANFWLFDPGPVHGTAPAFIGSAMSMPGIWRLFT